MTGVLILKNLGGLGFFLQKNFGLAFSLPVPARIMGLVIGLILIALLTLLVKNFKNKSLVVFLSLIIIGALSNVIDRIVYGYVVDYINVFVWPVFNLADVLIVVGVASWLVLEWKKKKN